MGKTKVKKVNSSKSSSEEHEVIKKLRDQIVEYTEKHNFHEDFVNMTSEAFKLKDPNPWLSIGVKALNLAGKTYSDIVFIEHCKHENDLLRGKLDWYMKNTGNYDQEYEEFKANKAQSKSEAEKRADSTSSNHSASPDPEQRQKMSTDPEKSPKSPENSVETNKPSVVEEKKPKVLKLKLKLPEKPAQVELKELSVSTVDLCDKMSPEEYKGLIHEKEISIKSPLKLEDQPPIKLKLKLKPKTPMVVIPNENLTLYDEQPKTDHNIPGTSKKAAKSPLPIQKAPKFSIFGRKRKIKPKADDDLAPESKIQVLETPSVSNDAEKIKEIPFKLKLKLPRTVSEITVSNAEVATPTGNVLLPPKISIISEEDAKLDNEMQPMEVDHEPDNLIKACESKEIFSDIENQMMSIHEDKHAENTPTADTKIENKSAICASDTLTLTQEAMLDKMAFTQTELKELREIAALEFSSSSQSLKLSEELTEGSPVKNKQPIVECDKKKIGPNFGGKQLNIKLSSDDNSKVEVSRTDTDIGSSEDITKEESAGIETGGGTGDAVVEKKPIHTLASDDFEPDYEPDED